ncbi:MAG: DegT/DnrJ/EryC1/StrS family aminotransferase [Candidatus Omnitrophica bacterium]|nr:DegT/DnrJ/EryC1/StrS family aminotransferase [Candidatus Omnitrophota bacterium]
MIPIAKTFLDKREIEAVAKVLSSGWITQGPRVKEFEDAIASYVGARYACSVSSCTTALHLALLCVGVRPGDIVVTVSHSFIATANSIRHCGAEPLFVDIDLETYNMSAGNLEKTLKEDCEAKDGGLFYKNASGKRGQGRIAAIMPVHQMGTPCDLKAILSISRRFGLPVVEDAACAIGSEITIDNGTTWDKIGRPHGDIACFSFHPRKLLTTGEGGMVTTNNDEFDKRLRLLKQHGMSISDRIRHDLKKVVFEEYLVTGYNYRMSDIHAAVGLEQLKKMPGMFEERRGIAKIYQEGLKDIEWLKSPLEPLYCRTNWQSYPVRVLEEAPVKRDLLMQSLLDKGIATRRGIMNAHQEKAYALPGKALKNSETARDSVILLPLFCGMKKREIKKVICEIKDA